MHRRRPEADMSPVRIELPATETEARCALYAGAIFHLPGDAASARLVREAWAALETELGENPRESQFRMTDGDFFDRIGQLRKAIYTGPRFHALVAAVLQGRGFDPTRTACDPARLRVISHKGYENPAAAPIYYAHRDTWYAHSQAEITWWVPLHDVTPAETFVFYPDWFDRLVPNNSEAFDHDNWTRHGAALRIGWQNPEHGRTHIYPGQVGEFDPGREVGFAAAAGDVVLFAGAHFHQTRKNATGRTRFSLDFRTVDLEDHASGGGAPNADNRSTGCSIKDYIRLPVE
jgi:hypothetical protein